MTSFSKTATIGSSKMQLREWRDSETCSLLWINQWRPGKKKITLMIALVRKLSSVSPRNPQTVTLFFCQKTNVKLNTAIVIPRGIFRRFARNWSR